MKDIIDLYFDGISKVANLSAEEEKKLARLMEKGKRAEIILRKDCLNSSKKRVLLQNVENGEKAREEFIKRNLKLVITVAKNFLTFWGELKFLDLIQEGNIGLMRAVDKFDWRKNRRFSTYAVYWIKQMILRGIGDKGIQIRVPIYLREYFSFIKRETETLRMELGREPSLEEIAEKTKLSFHKIKALEKRARIMPGVVSLESVTEEDSDKGESNLMALIEDQTEKDPREDIFWEFLKEDFAKIFEKVLRPKEKMVLEKRFGFNGNKKTLKEVGKELGVTRERARQIQNMAIKKIRRRILGI